MNILYHLTTPPPVFAGTDAVFQEIEILRSHCGGELFNLFPSQAPSLRRLPRLDSLRRFLPIPKGMCRLLPALKKREAHFDLHHVYYNTFYPYTYLAFLKKPVIYSVVGGLQYSVKPLFWHVPKSLHTVVITNDRDIKGIEQWGVNNYRIIKPGIDASRFSYAPLPYRSEFVLLVGSAPWIHSQFQRKGIDLLLDIAARIAPLKLIFLWRGYLARELEERIARRGIAHKVEIINAVVDVNQVLARAHATVVLAETPSLVKAYPHSLLESLAAGKPILVSAAIPMADYVFATKCGVVVPGLGLESLTTAIEVLMRNYSEFQANALRLGCRDFSMNTMLAAFSKLYREVCAGL